MKDRMILKMLGISGTMVLGAIVGLLIAMAGSSAQAQSGPGCITCLATNNCHDICGDCAVDETCNCNTRNKFIIGV